MSFKQKIENYDKIWLGVFITSLIILVTIYTINYFYAEEFSVFDSISLFLYSILPGILVIVSVWAIKSGISQYIPKKSLILLSLSFVSWFIAEQLWMLNEYVFHVDSFPSMADIFYVSAPSLMLISLLIFLKPLKNKITRKNIIIAIFFSISLLIPTVIITYQENEDSTLLELTLLLTYPIADALVLIPTIIIISLLFSSKKDPFWVMMLIGIITLIAADTLFLFLELNNEYYDNHPVDLLWLLSYVIWTFAVLRSVHYSQKNYGDNIDFEKYQKYQTKVLTRYGIISFLIIINVLVIIVLFSIHYLLASQPDLGFLEFFSAFLVMMMIIFSGMIILINKSMFKDLESRTSKLNYVSEKLIKTERFSAIGELASMVAHDLRNPLSIIMASNAMIQEKSPNKEISKNSELIERSLERMKHQIDNVLDFVRVKPLILKQYFLYELIDEAMENITMPKEILLERPKTNPKIFCDKEQLSIVLYNIIFNAIQKLTGKGTINIIYEKEILNHIIKIQDSGDAIPESNKEKIFEPLFTTKHQGTGLGLASCKQIIEEHKGSIYTKNDPTTFIIKIPMEAK